MAQKDLGNPVAVRAEREGYRGPRPGHISGAGLAASAGGPAHQGLTAWESVRLRAPPPRGGQKTGPRSLPSAPQSRPENLPLRSAIGTGPAHSQLSSLLCHLPSLYPLCIPHNTGIL